MTVVGISLFTYEYQIRLLYPYSTTLLCIVLIFEGKGQKASKKIVGRTILIWLWPPDSTREKRWLGWPLIVYATTARRRDEYWMEVTIMIEKAANCLI